MVTRPPGQQRDEVLSQLRATRDAMMSPAWLTRIRVATAQQQSAAADSLLKVHLAILDFENLKLEEIRDDILNNSDDLRAATEKIKSVLKNLQRVATVLKAVGDLLAVVGKVVTLF